MAAAEHLYAALYTAVQAGGMRKVALAGPPRGLGSARLAAQAAAAATVDAVDLPPAVRLCGGGFVE